MTKDSIRLNAILQERGFFPPDPKQVENPDEDPLEIIARLRKMLRSKIMRDSIYNETETRSELIRRMASKAKILKGYTGTLINQYLKGIATDLIELVEGIEIEDVRRMNEKKRVDALEQALIVVRSMRRQFPGSDHTYAK